MMMNLPEGTQMYQGIVTLANWVMMPDGETYVYVYGRWAILTDKMVADIAQIPGFKSTEKWIAIGYGCGPEPLQIVPGCQVKNIALCTSPAHTRPTANQCYDLMRSS